MSNSGIDNLKIIVDKDKDKQDSQKLPLNSSTPTPVDNKKLSLPVKYSQKYPFNSVHKFFINYY